MTSAMEEHEVGWPDLAAEVDVTEWIRSQVAASFNSAIVSDDMMIGIGIGKLNKKSRSKIKKWFNF
jgi:hypothetical protein